MSYGEGQTATNPQTGERVVFRNGQWQPLETVPQGSPSSPSPDSPPPVIYGRPKPVDPYKVSAEQRAVAGEARATEDQSMQREQFNWQRERAAAQDARDAAKAAKDARLPATEAQRLRDMVAEVTNMQRARAGFKDDYAGIGAGIESTLQGYLGVGTPGQRDWWADFRRSDNIERNELFGASLSAGEKAAYQATTISPNMTPAEIRANIDRRQKILSGALARQAEYLRENGYGDGPINALIGDALGGEAQTRSVTAKNADGTTFTFDVPKDATPTDVEQIGNAELRKRGIMRDGVAKGFDKPLTADEQARVDRQMQGADNAIGAGAYGLADTVTFGFADELAAGLNAAFGEGSGSFGDRYDSALRVERATRDELRGKHGVAYGSGQLGGALAVPLGAGARGVNALARWGGAQGAAYGFGSSDGDTGSRFVGAGLGGALGAAGGAATGYVAPRAVNAFARWRGAGNQAGADVMAAADRLGVRVMPADVGGPKTRLLTAGAGTTVLGGAPLKKAALDSLDDLSAARGRIAGGAGGVLPADEAGMLVQGAAKRFATRSSQVGSRLYDRANRAAQGVRIKPIEALRTVDDHIAELSQSGELSAPAIADLQRLRNSLAQNGGVTVTGVRNIRTALADAARRDGLRGTDIERRMGMVVEAVSRDVERGLQQAGRPQAVNAFRTADRFWAQRVEHIDDVLDPILGNGAKSGEDILKAVQSMTQGGSGGVQRLSGLMKSLAPGEAGSIRATLINRLGRVAKDAGEGEAFSPSIFVSHWEAMPAKAKRALFGTDPQLVDALDDLAKVSGAAKAAQKYQNHSNTGTAITVQGGVAVGTGVLTGGVAPAALAGLAGINYATGRLLSSARFARHLAKLPQAAGNPQRMAAWQSRLQRIGKLEPVLLADINAFEQRLLGPSVTQAAASPDSERGPDQLGQPEEK